VIPTHHEWSSYAPVAMNDDYWLTVCEDLVMISAGGRYRVLWKIETMPAKLAPLAATRITT
jgi:hypothetical protein